MPTDSARTWSRYKRIKKLEEQTKRLTKCLAVVQDSGSSERKLSEIRCLRGYLQDIVNEIESNPELGLDTETEAKVHVKLVKGLLRKAAHVVGPNPLLPQTGIDNVSTNTSASASAFESFVDAPNTSSGFPGWRVLSRSRESLERRSTPLQSPTSDSRLTTTQPQSQTPQLSPIPMPQGANAIDSSQSQPQGTDAPGVPAIIVTDFSQQEKESRPPADLLTISLPVPCQSTDGDEEERDPVTDSEISSLLSRPALKTGEGGQEEGEDEFEDSL